MKVPNLVERRTTVPRSRQRTRRWWHLALVLALVCGACAPAADDSTSGQGALVDAIKSKGVLKVGVAQSPPNIIKDAKTGEWGGVFPDLARYWAKQLDVKPEFVETDFANMVSGIQANRFDIAVDLTKTPERAEAVNFSRPVRKDIGAFVLRRGEPDVQTFAELNSPGLTICVGKGSSYDRSLEKIEMRAKLLRLANPTACLAALEARRVDAVYWAWTTVGEYAEAHSGTGIVFPDKPLVDDPIGVAVSKKYTAEDLEPLNEAIATWTSSPNGLSASLERWKATTNPLDYAVGDVPDYVKDAAELTFGTKGQGGSDGN